MFYAAKTRTDAEKVNYMPINGIRVENNKFLGTGIIHNKQKCDRTKCMLSFLRGWANQTPEYNNFNNELYDELNEKLTKYKDNVIIYSLFSLDVLITNELNRTRHSYGENYYDHIFQSEFTFDHNSLTNDIAFYADNAKSEKEIAQKIINLYPKDGFNIRYCLDCVVRSRRDEITEDQIKTAYREMTIKFLRKLAYEGIFFNSKDLLDSNIIPVPVIIKENWIKIAFFYLHRENN